MWRRLWLIVFPFILFFFWNYAFILTLVQASFLQYFISPLLFFFYFFFLTFKISNQSTDPWFLLPESPPFPEASPVPSTCNSDEWSVRSGYHLDLGESHLTPQEGGEVSREYAPLSPSSSQLWRPSNIKKTDLMPMRVPVFCASVCLFLWLHWFLNSCKLVLYKLLTGCFCDSIVKTVSDDMTSLFWQSWSHRFCINQQLSKTNTFKY